MHKALEKALEHFASIRVGNPSLLSALERVEAVAVVGASCVGKSSLVEAVRASAACRSGGVDVPRRYVTRAPRSNESPEENLHVPADQFEKLVQQNTIRLHWRRRMEAGREIRYGFVRPEPGTLPVYSGNVALARLDSGLKPADALSRTLLVGVWAPDEVRAARLRARSPDLVAANPDEVAHRLAERADEVLPLVHLVVENHGALEERAIAELVELLQWLAQLRRAA